MQNAIKESRPIPPPRVTVAILRESFKKALEVSEDYPTEGLFESLCVVSGVATEKELFSDYKLFESSLRHLLGQETANMILTCMHDEILSGFSWNISITISCILP
jgi:hypothetical protein